MGASMQRPNVLMQFHVCNLYLLHAVRRVQPSAMQCGTFNCCAVGFARFDNHEQLYSTMGMCN